MVVFYSEILRRNFADEKEYNYKLIYAQKSFLHLLTTINAWRRTERTRKRKILFSFPSFSPYEESVDLPKESMLNGVDSRIGYTSKDPSVWLLKQLLLQRFFGHMITFLADNIRK
ncbi:hypothetical protein LOAG_06918 [Loa loa]|uniref:Uncharacterized protein n=1 Tax=Loa loa TaxID=7209 RepID=A0A1S0TX08_LOALO|nr:hypothetical protein LOAG_06918 [Loa loa]EFO21571.1 hypothetical protein LOAG_06918 [Loa loa]